MLLRRALPVAAACGLAISLAPPAGAEQGLGVDTQFGGSVAVTTQAPSSLQVAGACWYQGTTTTSGGEMLFTFGGTAAAYSTVPTSPQPISTAVSCLLVSPKRFAGDADTLMASTLPIRMAGPAVTTQPASTGPWPIRPVYICIEGDGDFGPIPGTQSLPSSCSRDPLSIGS